MIAESSRISTILNAVDVDLSAKHPSPRTQTRKLAKTNAKQAKTGEELNNWEQCKPDILEDSLPQPYRTINKIVYQVILKEVYRKIEEIDKAKLHHNYEGAVKEITPTSHFDFDGVTCIAKDVSNPSNTALADDKYGNVLLLDFNKRVLITKHETFAGRRIIWMSAITIEYGDTNLTTFAVIARGEPNIQVCRYKSNDSTRFMTIGIIKLAKNISKFDEKTEVSELAYRCQFSPEGKFLAVSLYNGNVEIYTIPEPAPILPETDNLKNPAPGPSSVFLKPPTTTAGGATSPNSKSNTGSMAKIPEKTFPSNNANLQNSNDFSLKEFPLFKKIILKAPEAKKDVTELLTKMLLEDKNVPVQTGQTQGKESKDPKKPSSAQPNQPGGVGKGQPVLLSSQETKPDFERNDPVILGEYVKSNNGADISADLPIPEYKPLIFFIQSKFTYLPEGAKTLIREVVCNITTHIGCAWKKTNFIEIYEIQERNRQNIPKNYSHKATDNTNTHTVHPTTVHPTTVEAVPANVRSHERLPVTTNDSEIILKPEQTYSVIYPISACEINKSLTYLAIGMEDGSVVVWDLLLNTEKYQLDKHKKGVTCIRFYEDWRLITGSKDGGVNLHDLKDLPATKKYQHVFKNEKNPISAIEFSDSGIAFISDVFGNTRAYDIHHFEKIFKLRAQTQTSKKITFCVNPGVILWASKEQACILGDVLDSEEKIHEKPPNPWEKVTNVLIYRVFDNLVNVFPGLANIYRKGFDKNKLINAYSKLDFTDLKNPNYEFPNFERHTDKSIKDKDKSSIHKSKFSGLGMGFAFGSHDGQKKSPTSNTSKNSRPSNGKSSSVNTNELNTTYADFYAKKANQTALTQANLHPEKFFTEKSSLPPPTLVDPIKKTMESLRARNTEKNIRAEQIQNDYAKIKEYLDLEEERARLLKQEELLATAAKQNDSLKLSINIKDTIKSKKK